MNGRGPEAGNSLAESEITKATTVVASGPPNLWTILIAVFATASLSLGTEAYAADTEGILIVPWPAPATSRLITVKAGENWFWIIQRKGNTAKRAKSAPPAETARQPNLSVKNPTNGNKHIMPELHKDGEAIIRLMDANKGWPVKREEFRGAALKRITKTLMLYRPGLTANPARDMAFIVFHNMKAMKTLSNMADKKARSGAIKELRGITQLYLKNRLKRT